MIDTEIAAPELSLSPDKAYFILLRAREFDEKVEDTDPDSGSDPADDGAVDILEETADDATEAELADAVAGLNDDELLDLIALIWVGRGDFGMDEWDAAREGARDIGRERAPRYVTGIPLVSDYLEDGLSQAGFALADFMDTH
jgi:hypothetical protein